MSVTGQPQPLRALAVALVICCAVNLADTGCAQSGRGAGYQTKSRHQRRIVDVQVRRLDERLSLSEAQKRQIRVILIRRRSNGAPVAEQVRALLTVAQRQVYDADRAGAVRPR